LTMEQEAPDVAVQVRRDQKKRARSSSGPASRRAVVRMKNWGPSKLRSSINFIARSYIGANIVSTAAGLDVKGGFAFQLDALPNYTEITALYDTYRICKIQAKFIPANTNHPSGGAATIIPPFYTVIDYDNASTPAALNDLAQYSTFRIHQVNKGDPAVRYFTPRVAIALYGGAFTRYGEGKAKTWCDTQSADVQHYGIKYYWPTGVTDIMTLTPIFKFYIQCKNVI